MSASNPPRLSVLICSLNVRDHVMRCLESVLGRDQGITLEVILVDNASSDDTVERVREQWPQVHVVQNRANVGFAQANNQALARAKGEFVLFLNPDTEVGPGTLRRCVEELAGDPGLGMVGCRLLWPDGEIQYECARSAYRLGDLVLESFYLHRFFPRHRIFGRQLLGDWDHTESRDVEGMSGAFMMLPRTLANELGGMATDVFLYHEDMDLALRVRQRGFRIRYLADVWTIHYTSRSTVGKWLDPNWALLELEANSRLIRQMHGRPAEILARGIYFTRSLARMGVATVGKVIPGLRGVRGKYPTVFSVRRHALQAAWALSPRSVAHRVPSAPSVTDSPAPLEYLPQGVSAAD